VGRAVIAELLGAGVPLRALTRKLSGSPITPTHFGDPHPSSHR
jgi:hypothetical protein